MSPKNKALALTGPPLNFLLGSPDSDIASYELARLAEVANLRGELHLILDKLIDQMAAAALAGWFRQTNRETLTQALLNPEDVIAWAKERIRDQQRRGDELVPRPSLDPGAAHLAQQLRYAQRNLAEGKCSVCPRPLAPHSVRYCVKHLVYAAKQTAKARTKKKPWAGKGDLPGTIAWLYGDGVFQSPRGRLPGTLKALAKGNEGRTKKKKAKIEALVKCLPRSKNDALTQAELFEKAIILPKTIVREALQELLSAGQIQRIGAGCKGNPYRYFAKEANEKRAKKK